MAINYTYPVKAVPTVSDNVLIIDNEDTTNPRATKTVTIQSIVNLASGGGGGVTSVTGTAPVVSSGGTTPAISMAAATTSVNGYLTSTDWTTFNNKLTSVSGDPLPMLGGNLDVNTYSIVSSTGFDINITPDTLGSVVLDGIKYPQADGTGGQVLQTNGAGQLSFATVGNGDVTGPASSINNSIAVYDGTTGKVIKNNTGVTIDVDSNVILENWPESDGEFRGDLDGGVRFTAQADEALSKGDVVYISGASGANTLVAKAQANSTSTMPAFGFVNRDALSGTTVQIITFGNIYGSGTYPLDTTTDSEGNPLTVGDEIYVSSIVAGGYTNVKPSNETNLIQNIGKIVRVNVSNGVIKAGGAGRTNATPNLDSAKMFLGNSSNQSVSVAMSGDVTIDNTGVTTVGTINSVAVATVTSGAALGAAALPKSGGAMTGAITGNQDITGKRPIVSDSTPNFDLTLGIHEGTFIYSDSSLPVTVNIMANATQAFPVGTEIDLIQAGAGVVTITPAGGVNLNGANTAIPITAQWGGVTLKQITIDNWIIVGKI
jgi:trimeric autotransporter adhesin